MSKPFRVLQVGFGSIGRFIAQAVHARANLELAGVVDIDADLAGQRLDALLALEARSSVVVRSDLKAVLGELAGDPVDVAVVATSSSLERIMPTVVACLDAGLHVVSICEELSYPFVRYPALSRQLDGAARKAGRSVLGTGINPGFLMDLLPIVLSAPCQRVESITVTRQINSSTRRASFQRKIGTGMTQDAFRKAIDEGTITGHVGLLESIQMIGDALGWSLEKVEELPPAPVIASVEVNTPFTTVPRGQVLGLKSRGAGWKDEVVCITLDFFAFAGASPEYDEILIDGHPTVRQRLQGGMQGDYGTVGMVMNMIPLVVQAKPGLYTMKDLPCPRNTQHIWKQ